MAGRSMRWATTLAIARSEGFAACIGGGGAELGVNGVNERNLPVTRELPSVFPSLDEQEQRGQRETRNRQNYEGRQQDCHGFLPFER